LLDGQMLSSCSSATVGVGALFDSHSSEKALARASALGTLVASEQVAVQRGLAEFRGGRPVLFSGREPFVAMPIDGCDQQLLEAFRQTFNTAPLRLAITARRASALGIETKGPVTLHLNVKAEVSEIFSLAVSSSVTRPPDASPARPSVLASIDLAKLAGRLPAVLIADAGSAIPCALVQLEATAVSVFREQLISSLSIAASSVIPFEGMDAAQFVVFRNAIGTGHAAVVIGEPDLSSPILVRIHSACLTGDVFGSRRCDCGDQLKLAISRMRSSGGILLYLDQEGRGLGLLNKIRAYRLQDSGLDTIDANMTLGFEHDERDYRVAARMLQLLGCKRVVLLTNNPAKLADLSRAGIEICGRVPLQASITTKNRLYLATMARRAGHRLDHVWNDS
jgi:GTP cyclohydrolase II